MKRIGSVSLVALAVGALGGCAVQSGASEPSGNEPAARASTSTAASALGEHPEMILLRHTYWLVIPVPAWEANYGGSGGGVAPYSFPFPTPWLKWEGPANDPTVDFDGYIWERGYLMQIQSNGVQAADSFQYYVYPITTQTCTLPQTGAVIAVPPPSTCLGAVTGSAVFMTPFTGSAQAALEEDETSSLIAQDSDVQAKFAEEPILYPAGLNAQGQWISGETTAGAALLLGAPIAAYPYADVHDPKDPPN